MLDPLLGLGHPGCRRPGLDLRTLWSLRTRELAGASAERLWPPHLPVGGIGQLVRDSILTLQMSIAASAIASGLAVVVAFVAARPDGGFLHGLVSRGARSTLLFCRAIPPSVWALVLLFALQLGGLPGAAALGLYNFGILGRLLAEVVENHDHRPARACVAWVQRPRGRSLTASSPKSRRDSLPTRCADGR